MAQQQVADKDPREAMTRDEDDKTPYPNDPDVHTEAAPLTLVIIIGTIFLTMIIVMVGAFIYFQDFWEGPTSLILPFLI